MFNIINIKVGDYIETRDSEIGYITNIKDSLFLFRYKTKNRGLVGYCGNILDLGKYFKQIGTYVFDDKDKIKPLTPKAIYKDVKCKKIETKAEDYPSHIDINDIPYSYESILDHIEYDNMSMGVKINEIIKWINERG